MSGASISFRNVDFGIGARRILQGLSFDVRAGEFLAIVGPNGCGKSTTLKLTAGLQRPRAGTIAINGDDIGQLGRREMARRIAFLTQASFAPPNMTVFDLVALGRFAHQGLLSRRSDEDEAQIAAALDAMEVTELQDRRVGELSGGQLQRCRMAMVLAQDSSVLLLDEPTTYLDLRHQYGILDIARAQARAGRAVIAVLHDFTQASLYADRIAVMHQGRLVQLGQPAEVLTETVIAEVFGVQIRAVEAHGALFHIPRGALR